MATDDWSAMSDEEGWEEAGPAIGGSAASRGSPLPAGGAPRSAAIASKPSPPAASSPFAGAPPGATTKHHASGSIDWGDEEDDWRPGPPQSTPPQPAYARPSPGRAALGRSPAASGRITGFGPRRPWARTRAACKRLVVLVCLVGAAVAALNVSGLFGGANAVDHHMGAFDDERESVTVYPRTSRAPAGVDPPSLRVRRGERAPDGSTGGGGFRSDFADAGARVRDPTGPSTTIRAPSKAERDEEHEALIAAALEGNDDGRRGGGSAAEASLRARDDDTAVFSRGVDDDAAERNSPDATHSQHHVLDGDAFGAPALDDDGGLFAAEGEGEAEASSEAEAEISADVTRVDAVGGGVEFSAESAAAAEVLQEAEVADLSSAAAAESFESFGDSDSSSGDASRGEAHHALGVADDALATLAEERAKERTRSGDSGSGGDSGSVSRSSGSRPARSSGSLPRKFGAFPDPIGEVGAVRSSEVGEDVGGGEAAEEEEARDATRDAGAVSEEADGSSSDAAAGGDDESEAMSSALEAPGEETEAEESDAVEEASFSSAEEDSSDSSSSPRSAASSASASDGSDGFETSVSGSDDALLEPLVVEEAVEDVEEAGGAQEGDAPRGGDAEDDEASSSSGDAAADDEPSDSGGSGAESEADSVDDAAVADDAVAEASGSSAAESPEDEDAEASGSSAASSPEDEDASSSGSSAASSPPPPAKFANNRYPDDDGSDGPDLTVAANRARLEAKMSEPRARAIRIREARREGLVPEKTAASEEEGEAARRTRS